MKKYFVIAASALAITSCSNEDYLGNNDGNAQGGNTAIQFDGAAGKTTRATANSYNTDNLKENGFWVYGTKNNGTTDQVVYQNYRVESIENANNQTLTNIKGWEYVGIDNSKYADAVTPHLTGAQTIKYWDYSANSYTFYAATAKPKDLTDGKVQITKGTADNANTAGYTVTLKTGADLSQLYFADKVTIDQKNSEVKREAENEIGGLVKFNFRNALAKVRVAFFEMIPGYSVKIDKFYYTTNDKPNQTAESTNDFAADVKNTLLVLNDAGEQYTIDDDGILKVPTGSSVKQKDYITLGGNIQETDKLGETTNDATYDQSGKDYTWVLAQPENTSALKLKVDYTLTSLDGSKETIKVTGATATIPADYLKWKNNYAYTYIFKISDKTNGSTGGDDDPKGLYPITFDAAVITTGDGIQETITTASVPSITTYGKGAVGNEYKSGTNIYVSVAKNADGNFIELTNENAKLYKATVNGNYDVTEANVENCFKKGTQTDTDNDNVNDTWTVTETVNETTKQLQITSATGLSYPTEIPASDVKGGNAITGNFAKFTPNVTSDTYYIFEYIDKTTGTDGNEVKTSYYKVIKVTKK